MCELQTCLYKRDSSSNLFKSMQEGELKRGSRQRPKAIGEVGKLFSKHCKCANIRKITQDHLQFIFNLL